MAKNVTRGEVHAAPEEQHGPHCITIAYGNVHYRYFGRGVWRSQNIPIGGRWWPVNAVRVPTAVICEAAKYVVVDDGRIIPYDNGRSGKRAGRKA